jgi:tRNA (cmo5U34)-methyltransferase
MKTKEKHPARITLPLRGSVDRIYSKKENAVSDFNFGRRTAQVFDDMLIRSVPAYAEIQRMISEIATDFAVDNSAVYDLGCSTGTTLLLLDKLVSPRVRLVGIDNSPEMLQKAKEKFAKVGVRRHVRWECADLDQSLKIENASVVILNLTLQFIRPPRREAIIRKIAGGMREDGCLLLIEKVLSHDAVFNRNFIKYYYDFKQRNGYSQMEISQKREALENVLIPYNTKENEELLLKSGFSSCEIFFKWYNFCGYVARKAR